MALASPWPSLGLGLHLGTWARQGAAPSPSHPNQAPGAAHPGQRQCVRSIEALPPVDAVPVRGVQDGQRDTHPGRERQWGHTAGAPWRPWGHSPRPIFPSLGSERLLRCCCPTAAPQASACSGHSPDLCWLRQGPRAPVVPWSPAQSARGAGIRRHQKQAPADAVAVHTCRAHEDRPSPEPGHPRPWAPCRPRPHGPADPTTSPATLTGIYTCAYAEHAHEAHPSTQA